MIYFAEAVSLDMVKIGFASCPERRIKTLQTSSPFAVKLIATEEGGREKERYLHSRFKELRVREKGGGREWFHFENEIREYIAGGWKDRVKAWINGMPILFGRVCGPMYSHPPHRFCYITCMCPQCGQELNHGFCPGLDWGECSHRISHCNCKWPDGKEEGNLVGSGYFIAPDPRLSKHEIDPRIPLDKTVGQWIKERAASDWIRGPHGGSALIPFFEDIARTARW